MIKINYNSNEGVFFFLFFFVYYVYVFENIYIRTDKLERIVCLLAYSGSSFNGLSFVSGKINESKTTITANADDA